MTDVITAMSDKPKVSELGSHQSIIDPCFDCNSVEEIISVLQAHGEEWAQKTASLLLSKSPTSLKASFKQYHHGSMLDFDECMKMEYRVATRFLKHHDFYEGVRAAVIDKDRNPQWLPNMLKEVSEADIDRFFAPIAKELCFDD